MAIPVPEKRILDFEEMGFGMFIHWGLYSQLGKGEWVQHQHKIPNEEYEKLQQTFTASRFDGRKLAQIAKAGGVNTKRTAFMCYVVSAVFLGVAAMLRISIQGSIDTPMYMSSTNIIFNCLLGIYVGLALERYCNLVIGMFVGNFVLNMLTSGLMNMGLSYQQNSSYQKTTIVLLSQILFLFLVCILYQSTVSLLIPDIQSVYNLTILETYNRILSGVLVNLYRRRFGRLLLHKYFHPYTN